MPYRHAAIILGILLLACGTHAHAADVLPAGFTSAPVWLSTSEPVEGDRVEAFTVVYNASDEAIEGSLSFLIDDEVIGATPFSLRAGETEVRSVRWTAVRGTHALAARIDTAIYADDKREADIPARATASTTIRVASAPEKEERDEDEKASAKASSIVSTITTNPTLAGIINTIINTGESTRSAGETLVAGYAGIASSSTVSAGTDDGRVLGTSTRKDTTSEDRSIPQKVAATALPLFAYPALFYPILLLVLLVILWLVARRLRNPRRRRRR